MVGPIWWYVPEVIFHCSSFGGFFLTGYGFRHDFDQRPLWLSICATSFCFDFEIEVDDVPHRIFWQLKEEHLQKSKCVLLAV